MYINSKLRFFKNKAFSSTLAYCNVSVVVVNAAFVGLAPDSPDCQIVCISSVVNKILAILVQKLNTLLVIQEPILCTYVS
jgi:hypothetical protein